MFREITKKEALDAAINGKEIMMIYNLAKDDEPEDLVAVRLTEKIQEMTGHNGAVFLVNEKKTGGASTEAAPKVDSKPCRGVDAGKIRALTDAGWSAAKIADEMQISVQTVYNYQKKESK